MNLYEISNEYQELLEEKFNPETGEVLPLELDRLDKMAVKFEDKVVAVASYIRNLDAEREAIEKAREAMARREERLEDRVHWLTDYLRTNMEKCGISEIKSPFFVIKMKKCPLSVNITDKNIIPEDCKKTSETVSIDKLKIRDRILAGIHVPGAELGRNNRIEIR
jgi:Siphovirus Gp157